MTAHDGRTAPTLDQAFDPDDIDSFWVSWVDEIGNQEIVDSEWLLPSGWVSVTELQNRRFTDESTGQEITKANMVRLRTTHTDGTHHIVNRITTNQGNRLDRGFYLVVSKRL